MIVNLDQFMLQEQPYWDELASMLERIENDPAYRLELEEARRLYYLYRRSASGLAQLSAFVSNPEIYQTVEALVARAYVQMHPHREQTTRVAPRRWLWVSFPSTVRRHHTAFLLACAITFIGALFGAVALSIDEQAKATIMPFPHLLGNPADRVALEESRALDDAMTGQQSSFAAMLMVNNIRVSIMALSLGILWGLGTLLILFYNGVILGAVALDYVVAGQGVFLLGWLLPHGSVEIPAILLAGQAGLVLGGAILGYNNPDPLRRRLREVGSDLVTLLIGVALLLVWAGIVESFFSQYHAPLVPYWAKISFGSLQLVALFSYLMYAGKTPISSDNPS